MDQCYSQRDKARPDQAVKKETAAHRHPGQNEERDIAKQEDQAQVYRHIVMDQDRETGQPPGGESLGNQDTVDRNSTKDGPQRQLTDVDDKLSGGNENLLTRLIRRHC